MVSTSTRPLHATEFGYDRLTTGLHGDGVIRLEDIAQAQDLLGLDAEVNRKWQA